MYEKSNIYLMEQKAMSALKQYVEKRKAKDPEFAENYETDYLAFKIGVLLRQTHEEAGLPRAKVRKLKARRDDIYVEKAP